MRRRASVYANIKTLTQLKAERDSLDWHIKTVEQRLKSDYLTPRQTADSNALSKMVSFAAVAIPVSIAIFKLIKGISGAVKKR